MEQIVMFETKSFKKDCINGFSIVEAESEGRFSLFELYVIHNGIDRERIAKGTLTWLKVLYIAYSLLLVKESDSMVLRLSGKDLHYLKEVEKAQSVRYKFLMSGIEDNDYEEKNSALIDYRQCAYSIVEDYILNGVKRIEG